MTAMHYRIKGVYGSGKDGNIDITFNFAGVSLAGKTIVAFLEVS